MQPTKAGRRRLARRQHRAKRELERSLRVDVLAFARWCRQLGKERAHAARTLQLSGALMSEWQRGWDRDRLAPRPRGRPAHRIDRDTRNLVIGLLHLVGPQIGVRSLMRMLPGLGRRALQDLLRRYRAVHRGRRKRNAVALRWTRTGAIWAIDFTEAPSPIDGTYPYVLVVRDLASGEMLASLPTEDLRSTQVCGLLLALFREHGPPLILKSDNGSGLVAADVRDLLATWGVLALVSPPATPRYNGACEAGIGGLKTRAHHESVRWGRPGQWTCDDVETARLIANETARPRGRAGPTPEQAWRDRKPIMLDDRDQLAHIVERNRQEVTQHNDDIRGGTAAVNRIASTQALIALGYLELRTRRFSSSISSRRVEKIT